MEKYISAFLGAEVDFEILSELVEEDLKELGLPLGPRRKVWAAIQRLNSGGDDSTPETSVQKAKPAPQVNSPSPVLEAERRHLTVMFVDLVGSTEMAAGTDPEDMREVITGYQNTVAGVVARYEGFVAKFMGDGVLCYFGWPNANEDDAERAVRAGLDIIANVKRSAGPDGVALASRVGIATGVVVVGDLIGSGATQEAAVVGETPNLAARLQGVAQPDQIVLPQETLSLLGNVFTLNPLGTHDLKGIAEPVEAFGVIGENTKQNRFEARQLGALTPIVGRERETELMLERWSKTLSGQGQMVLVSGEAGIGKSRITRAVIDAIAQDNHIRMTYQCSPYHTDSAFYPIIQQLSYAAGFKATDGVEARLDKLEALIGLDVETLALIAPLLGLDGEERYSALDLSPAQQRARTMKTLVRLMKGQAQDKPLLMVFEDLHWVDPTTLEFLDLALEEIAGQPILLLTTARPNFEYGFGGHPIVTRFALNRLGRDQIAAIADKLAAGKSLPDEVIDIIASRTDGVPLFVEELTKTILETGVLRVENDRLVLDGPLDTLAIPNTLHDSLMARLDRLQPIKEVAQTAACIGRAFDHRLLANISPLPETELTTALGGLIKAELIYRRGLPPEATYLFKHALVRDAAYESLLKERRRGIHTKILAALENDVDIAPEVLAVHAESSRQIERAIDLWESASKVAIARPAFDESILHLSHAIRLITPQMETGDTTAFERALTLQVQLGMTLLARKGYTADETLAAFEHALTMADEVGDTPVRYSILYGLWIGMAARGQLKQAWSRAEELIHQAEKSPETAPLMVANRIAGASCWLMGDFPRARHFLDVALTHFDPVEHKDLGARFGQDIGVSLHIFIALNELTLGHSRDARSNADKAELLAETTNHVNTICYALCIRAIFSLADRDYVTVERCVAKLLPITEEHSLNLWFSIALMIKEILAARTGDKSSLQRFISADDMLGATKFKMFMPALRVEFSRALLAMGLKDQAVGLVDKAHTMIMQSGEQWPLSDLNRLQASLAKADNDLEAVENHLHAALDVARHQGAKMWELRAAIDLASLWHDAGRTEDAIALLQPIYDCIDEGDCPEDRAVAQTMIVAFAS